MITTEHQYRITKDRFDRFDRTLVKLKKKPAESPLQQARVDAVVAQLRRLRAEMDEYNALKSGRIEHIDASTLLDLPVALIKARIARGLSQSALAELIGVQPQQVQRWETGRYRKVAFERLSEIAQALNVSVSERVDLSRAAPVPLLAVRRSLQQLGFTKKTIDDRILPRELSEDGDVSLSDEVDARVELLLGMRARDLAANRATLRTSQLRFKLPASASQMKTRAYSHYVEALCRIAAKTLVAPSSQLPTRWQNMRELVFPDGIVDLRAALNSAWKAGVAVMPLSDSIAFHGACWRENGRTVIVLKQGSKEEARWLLDLIHELFHAASEPLGRDFAIIEEEETSSVRRESVDERRAQRFAAEVVTNGRTQELTDRIAQLASNQGPRLKSAAQAVSKETNVPVGVLANILAYRLAESGMNWWPVAANLQPSNGEPWKIVRKCFFENADLVRLSRIERSFLMQALETRDG
jgi:transcriptional regulator with XRE-family HTH domain/Zn-dependent peptidase ImmA (M78 family)